MRLSDVVVERIEHFVREEGLKPGDSLPSERDLMNAFSVGRSAIREAISTLSKRGLISVRNGERAKVSAPNPKIFIEEMSGAAQRLLQEPAGVHHFQDARLLLEVGVAERAAKSATADDIEKLRAILETNRRAIGDQTAFENSDFAFHHEIARIARNPIFTAVNEALFSWLIEQRNTSGRNVGAGDAAYAAHLRIFEAIAAHDPPEAMSAMRDHLEAVHKLYWKVFEDKNAIKLQQRN
jgi:GntR family transcriptional regulator, sialic acid-inducible nan operon repressor